MFTSVHSRCVVGAALHNTLVRIRVSQLCEFGQTQTFTKGRRTRVLSSKNRLVPFKGVVARAAIGGVCPMRAHLPEPHFDVVSEDDRKRSLLASSFTRLLRRMQHAAEMRSIRAVKRADHLRDHVRVEVCPCLGSGRLLRRELVVRTHDALLHTMRNYRGPSCVNAWDTM